MTAAEGRGLAMFFLFCHKTCHLTLWDFLFCLPHGMCFYRAPFSVVTALEKQRCDSSAALPEQSNLVCHRTEHLTMFP